MSQELIQFQEHHLVYFSYSEENKTLWFDDDSTKIVDKEKLILSLRRLCQDVTSTKKAKNRFLEVLDRVRKRYADNLGIRHPEASTDDRSNLNKFINQGYNATNPNNKTLFLIAAMLCIQENITSPEERTKQHIRANALLNKVFGQERIERALQLRNATFAAAAKEVFKSSGLETQNVEDVVEHLHLTGRQGTDDQQHDTFFLYRLGVKEGTLVRSVFKVYTDTSSMGTPLVRFVHKFKDSAPGNDAREIFSKGIILSTSNAIEIIGASFPSPELVSATGIKHITLEKTILHSRYRWCGLVLVEAAMNYLPVATRCIFTQVNLDFEDAEPHTDCISKMVNSEPFTAESGMINDEALEKLTSASENPGMLILDSFNNKQVST